MEPPRPSPPITIEGGRGWALADDLHGPAHEPDVLLAGDDDEPSAPRRRRRLVGLAVAVAVGFAAGALVTDLRTETLGEDDAGALSLTASSDVPYTGLAATRDGQPAVAVPLVLRNTGPLEVALDEAELLGTGLRAEGLDGARVAPGEQHALQLLRPVDCDGPDDQPRRLPGALRVKATTSAGSRSVDLRLTSESMRTADEIAQAVCGRVPPQQALMVQEATSTVEGDALRVPIDLGNGSREEVQVLSVQAASGLRVRALVDGDGAPVALPIVLPGGDFSEPREPWLARGTGRRVVVVLEVPACAGLLSREDALGDPGGYWPLVELELGDDRGLSAGRTAFGDPSALQRLRAAVCPSGG